MTDVFNQDNAANRPAGSKFFLGETALHVASGRMFTVCSLCNYEKDHYGLWELGTTCAIPTHGAFGRELESVAAVVESKLLTTHG